MDLFSKHLNAIERNVLINSEAAEFNELEQNFLVIRKYLIEILRTDPVLDFLLNEEYIDRKFNTSFVLDIQRICKCEVEFVSSDSGALCLPQVEESKFRLLGSSYLFTRHRLNGDVITRFVQNLINDGLRNRGCFVAGHKGDVYELDVIKGHERPNGVVIRATTEYTTILMRFRILINFNKTQVPLKPQVFHRKCGEWPCMAEALINLTVEKYKSNLFAIFLPNIEENMLKSNSYIITFRLLKCLFQTNHLFILKNFFLLSAVYNDYMTAGSKIRKIKDIMIGIMSSMVQYFERQHFPHYYNTKVNLLNHFKSEYYANSMYKKLRMLLSDMRKMERDKELSQENVWQFFGIEYQDDFFYIDNFGIFRRFK